MPSVLTRKQAREELDRRGISIAEFSRAHDLNPNLVSDLLAGRKKGMRGEAHRAAVLLGIKDGVINDTGDFPLRRESPATKSKQKKP